MDDHQSSPLRSPKSPGQGLASPESVGRRDEAAKPVTGFAFTYSHPDPKQQSMSAAKAKQYKSTLSQAERLRKAQQASAESASGRASRQSKDSKLLETVSDDESISSGHSSEMDEYEREMAGSTGVSSANISSGGLGRASMRSRPGSKTSGAYINSSQSSPKTAKSPPPPVKPKPTSLFSSDYLTSSSLNRSGRTNASPGGYGAPNITHASRKLMVTNADGSTIETEEVLDPKTSYMNSRNPQAGGAGKSPSSFASTTTKPVVVGVVPSSAHSTSTTPVKQALGTFTESL